MDKPILTYDDLLQIVELIKSAESFSEFHLKIGDIELDLKNTDAAPAASIPVPAAAGVSPSAPANARPAPDIPTGAVVIRSPMVGTFYRSPEPGARPFVEAGQAVSPDTTVCIIEVMKLMNSISAGCEGTVLEMLVQDAEPVDAGQMLIVIEPKA